MSSSIPPTIPSDANHTSVHTNKVNVTKGTVTQTGNITDPVTINAAAGVITTVTSALALNATTTFVVNNSSCSATSVVIVNVIGYAGTDATAVITANVVDIGEGVFSIQFGNGSAASLDNVLTIGFLIV